LPDGYARGFPREGETIRPVIGILKSLHAKPLGDRQLGNWPQGEFRTTRRKAIGNPQREMVATKHRGWIIRERRNSGAAQTFGDLPGDETILFPWTPQFPQEGKASRILPRYALPPEGKKSEGKINWPR